MSRVHLIGLPVLDTHDGRFAIRTAADVLTLVLVLRCATNVGLVHLYRTAQLRARGVQHLPT